MKYSNRGFRGARRHSCGKIVRVLKKQGALMNIRQIVLFSCVILIAIFATLVVWPRAALTQQGATPQKQQTPTIDEYQPRNGGTVEEYRGRNEGAISGPVCGVRKYELRRFEHAGVREARGGAAGRGRQERRARIEDFQEFRDGLEIYEWRTRPRRRSDI